MGQNVSKTNLEQVEPLPTLPVSLLSRGRPCLVVGAGKIAARKAEQLCEADACVTMVGIAAGGTAHALAAQGRIQLLEREFQEEDVVGMFLVYAATNDAAANRSVLEACRRHGILCGCVDVLWRDGDLISPAVLRRDDLTLAVSTGGRACRRSRLVRDSLSRHLNELDTAELLVIGTSHQYIPLRQLESYCLSERLEQTGRLLRGVRGLHEFLLLSTCNRVELLALAATDEDVHELLRRAVGLGLLPPDAYYIRRGAAAFEHASLLAAGLLSQTIGESHIVAQIKDALTMAEGFGWSGGVMQAWMSSVLHVSKEIRAVTKPALPNADLEELIVAYLESQRPGFGDEMGMVIGTGSVGSRLVEQLMARGGNGRLYWCYRTRPAEVPLGWQNRIVVLALSEIKTVLNGCAYVVAAVSGATQVLRPEHAAQFANTAEVLIVDAGMPRNVDPELAVCVPGLRLLNLAELKQWQHCDPDEIASAIKQGQLIVNEHRDLYEKTIRNIQSRHASE